MQPCISMNHVDRLMVIETKQKPSHRRRKKKELDSSGIILKIKRFSFRSNKSDVSINGWHAFISLVNMNIKKRLWMGHNSYTCICSNERGLVRHNWKQKTSTHKRCSIHFCLFIYFPVHTHYNNKSLYLHIVSKLWGRDAEEKKLK